MADTASAPPESGAKLPKRKIGKVGRTLLIALLVLVVVLGAAAAFAVYKWNTGNQLKDAMFAVSAHAAVPIPSPPKPSPTPEFSGKATIEHKGKQYVLKEDVFSILFMGIDTTDAKQYDQIGFNSNQADSLILAVIEPSADAISFINIPRNTLTAVKQLDVNMNYARTTLSPICIQHAFGDGAALSCELTREAASNLLYGVSINRYVALNLDGLFKANDAIGGVTVKLLDDMTEFNSKMKKGETYTLNGKDAQIYVARRLGKNLDGKNLTRVNRQVQYYKAFFTKAKDELQQSPMFALDLYNSMKDSMHTDLTTDEVIYLSKTVIRMDMNEDRIHTLQGTADEQTDDFYVDDDALKDLLIDVFYSEYTEGP